MRNQLFLLLIALSVGLSKEDKQKTLIIAVDEEKPEKTTAIISDLDLESLEGQSSAPNYRTSGRPYKPKVLQSSSNDKQLGYILLTPEDLKRLQNLEGVSVEEPKHVTLPHTLSEDNYEDDSPKERYPVRDEPKYISEYPSSAESPAPYQPGYPPESSAPYQPGYSPESSSPYQPGYSPESSAAYRPGYPPSPPSESHNYYSSPQDQKYPLRPAPPLTKLSGSNATSYDSPSKPTYSYGNNQYEPYNSVEKGVGSPYENSKSIPSDYPPPSPYEPSTYSSPESYSAPRDPYEKPLPALHVSKSEYNSYGSKSPGSYSPEPYMYSGYKSPQTGGYSKHNSDTPPSGYSGPHYKYPIKPINPSHQTKTLSSPSKYIEDVPHRPYIEPSSASYDSSKKPYIDSAPYKNTYTGNSVHNNDIPSYGTRTKYVPENLPPSHSYSSKQHYEEPAYPQKDTYTVPIKKYKTYNDKPYYTSPPDSSSKGYSDGSKSSYSDITGPSYKEKMPPSSDGYYHPPSSSYSGRYPKNSSPPSHQTPIHSGKSSYSGRSPSKVRVEIPEENSRPSPYAYENNYPSNYKSVSSGEDGYISSPISSKSHSSYHGPSSPKNAVVTSFYGNPTSYPSKGSSYEGKHSEEEPLPHSTKYDSPSPSKYAIEDGKPVKHAHYEVPNYESTLKDTPYYTQDNGHEVSTKFQDSHSVAKNYKPSRPAPLYDQYEQPRYPPLPGDIKDSSEKDIPYADYKHHSGEKYGIHEEGGKSYHAPYTPNSYSPASYEEKSQPYQTGSKYSNPGDYSGPSSHEENDPVVYTKTYTKTYTKPQSDSSTEGKYDHSSEDAYITSGKYSPSSSYSSNNKYPTSDSYNPNNEYAPPDSYSSKSKYPSSDSYSKYSEPDSYSSKSKYSPSDSYTTTDSKSKNYASNSDSYVRPHSYSNPSDSSEYTYRKPSDSSGNKFKYYTQDSEETPYSQLPKRVEGVVYRTRKTHPTLQSPRQHKSYLPYKVYDPKYAPAFDHKIYENAPEQNVTKGPSKAAFKLKYKPVKNVHHNKDTEHNEDSYVENGFANIPGEAGKDFPILKEIPYTHFSCENRAPGFYADVEHRCQVYYQCSDKGRVQSFLCPNGTIFNQETFVCEWWHNVDCAKSEKHYSKNDNLYKSPAKASSEYVAPEKYYRHPSHVQPSEDNYRGHEQRATYEKPIRKRRRNHSTVTYTSE